MEGSYVLFAVEAARWKVGGSVTWLWPGFPQPPGLTFRHPPAPTVRRQRTEFLVSASRHFLLPGWLYRRDIATLFLPSIPPSFSTNLSLRNSIFRSSLLFYHPNRFFYSRFNYYRYSNSVYHIIMSKLRSKKEWTRDKGYLKLIPSTVTPKRARESDPRFFYFIFSRHRSGHRSDYKSSRRRGGVYFFRFSWIATISCR